MDDARIEQIRREVLAALGGAPTAPAARAAEGLEARVAALEAAVAQLRPAPPAPSLPIGRGHAHASLQVLGPGGSQDRCLMEPDKPCVQSHACRTFGH